MNNQQRHGENKIIGEEALAGGLLGLASATVASSLFLDPGTLQAAAAWILPSAALPVSSAVWQNFTQHFAIAAGKLSISGALATAGLVGGFLFFGFQRSQWHHDGMQFIDDYEAGRQAMQANEEALFSAAQKMKEVEGIKLGGVEFSRTREVGHISIVGLPGAGKTVIINNQVYQIINRGDRIIIHDPKGDFTSWIYSPEDTILLGPWDKRASCWDIANDISDPELAVSFAASLTAPGPGEKGDPFFDGAARDVIAGLMKYYMATLGNEWSWDVLADDLSTGGVHLIQQAVKGDPVIKTLCPDYNQRELNKTSQSILATVAKSVSWVLAYAGTYKIVRRDDGRIDRNASNMFAIKQWIAKENYANIKKVVLNNNKNYEVRAAQIFGAMLASAANYINSSKMPEVGADKPGLHVVLDEYPQLGKAGAKYIQQIEELGRSRGVRVTKAMQDESQLYSDFGREQGQAQKSVQQTRIYCKLATGTASDISKSLGDRRIVRIEMPQAVGAGNKRAVVDKYPVIEVGDLTGLKVVPGQGVEMVVHTDSCIVKLMQPFIDRELIKEVNEKVIDNDEFIYAALKYAAMAIEEEKEIERLMAEVAKEEAASKKEEAIKAIDEAMQKKKKKAEEDNLALAALSTADDEIEKLLAGGRKIESNDSDIELPFSFESSSESEEEVINEEPDYSEPDFDEPPEIEEPDIPEHAFEKEE